MHIERAHYFQSIPRDLISRPSSRSIFTSGELDTILEIKYTRILLSWHEFQENSFL